MGNGFTRSEIAHDNCVYIYAGVALSAINPAFRAFGLLGLGAAYGHISAVITNITPTILILVNINQQCDKNPETQHLCVTAI